MWPLLLATCEGKGGKCVSAAMVTLACSKAKSKQNWPKGVSLWFARCPDNQFWEGFAHGCLAGRQQRAHCDWTLHSQPLLRQPRCTRRELRGRCRIWEPFQSHLLNSAVLRAGWTEHVPLPTASSGSKGLLWAVLPVDRSARAAVAAAGRCPRVSSISLQWGGSCDAWRLPQMSVLLKWCWLVF